MTRSRPRRCRPVRHVPLARRRAASPSWRRTEREADWDWVKWLPHAQDERRVDAAGPQRLVFDSMAALEEVFGDDLSTRPRHTLRRQAADHRPAPAGDPRRRRGRPRRASCYGQGLLGTTVLDLSGTVPRDSRPVAAVPGRDGRHGRRRSRRQDHAAGPPRPAGRGPGQRAGPPARPVPAVAPDHRGGAAPRGSWSCRTCSGSATPRAVDPLRTWRPRPNRERLRIPLGIGPDGNAVELDFKEAAQEGMGPHGLIIGATGSGKSELLRTIVSSLAITHSSEELNFVLVDFKGGATFASLDALPHTSAVITNLADELSMVDRMQDALAGEMMRRQELLRAAGNYVSRFDYEKARAAGEPLTPLPSLLIICDEFSELLAAKPDFIDLFVMIGRLGRSLGVHLLLASQRLEEGRLRGLDTHLSYRIGLRTFSAMESRIVLGVPDAYELPNAPGHGYLKSDTQTMLRFRAAYVSGPYRRAALPAASQAAVQPPDRPVRAWASCPRRTQPVERAAGAARARGGGGQADLDARRDRRPAAWAGHAGPPGLAAAAVRAAEPDRAARRAWSWIRPAGWWRRPGPARAGWPSRSGIVDRPYEQRRDPLIVELDGAGGNVVIVGGPRSGKSTMLRSLLCSLALTHSPREVQFFCLDFGGGTLRGLDGLPHLSGVAGRRDIEAVRRTVAEATTLIDEREARFGGFHTPTDGLAKAVRAAEAQARQAMARGATFLPHTEVIGVLEKGGRVTGVDTTTGVIDADIVVCAAGFWGAQLAKQVGLVVPLVPMAHQYARTGQIAALVGRNTEQSEAGCRSCATRTPICTSANTSTASASAPTATGRCPSTCPR